MTHTIRPASTSVLATVVEDTLDVRPLERNLVVWRCSHVRRTQTTDAGRVVAGETLSSDITCGITTAEILKHWKKTRPEKPIPLGADGVRWSFLKPEQIEALRCHFFGSEAVTAVWKTADAPDQPSDWDIAGDPTLLSQHQLVGIDYSSHAMYNAAGEFLPTALKLDQFYTGLTDRTYDLDAVAASLAGRRDLVWVAQSNGRDLPPGELPPLTPGRWDTADDDDDREEAPARMLEGRWAPDVETFRAVMKLAGMFEGPTPGIRGPKGLPHRPSGYAIGLAIRLLDPFGIAAHRRGEDPMTHVPPGARGAVEAFLASRPPRPAPVPAKPVTTKLAGGPLPARTLSSKRAR